MAAGKIYAIVDYEDGYVQPLLTSALHNRLPPELLHSIQDCSELPSNSSRLLQWRQYESIDLDHLMSNPKTCMANSNIIRKALIRKHYLSTTVRHWMARRPDSELGQHVQPTVEFEVDYAEFLDDALLEAWELKDSWNRNLQKTESEPREWWILKPGMSDKGQGIRLFSSEEELQSIFEEWDPDDSEEEDDAAIEDPPNEEGRSKDPNNGIITSQLRHFIAQAYIHQPLLIPSPHPSAGRKFHIRTYVVSVGALQVYIYKPMLALFAAKPYTSPSEANASPNEELDSHLTNTCLQGSQEREGSVEEFWSLPSSLPSIPTKRDWKEDVFGQICRTTAQIFEAAARTMSVHFQPLPNAFEVFGVDFLVDAQGTAWLLEINAFPDFKQSGDALKGVMQGLFDRVVDVAVVPFFGLEKREYGKEEAMIKVLDIDLGRRTA